MLQVLSNSYIFRFIVFSLINIGFLFMVKNENAIFQSLIYYLSCAFVYVLYIIMHHFLKKNKNFVFIAISMMFFLKAVTIFSLLFWIDFKQMPSDENSKVGFVGIILFIFIYLELYFFNKKKV